MNIGSSERKFNEKVYEEIVPFKKEGFYNKRFYTLKSEKYNGDFSIEEIVAFEECLINRNRLMIRLRGMNNKEGNFTTFWDVISKPHTKVEVVRNKEQGSKARKKKINKKIEDFNQYINNMNLFPIGSLRKQSLIMQTKVYL